MWVAPAIYLLRGTLLTVLLYFAANRLSVEWAEMKRSRPAEVESWYCRWREAKRRFQEQHPGHKYQPRRPGERQRRRKRGQAGDARPAEDIDDLNSEDSSFTSSDSFTSSAVDNSFATGSLPAVDDAFSFEHPPAILGPFNLNDMPSSPQDESSDIDPYSRGLISSGPQLPHLGDDMDFGEAIDSSGANGDHGIPDVAPQIDFNADSISGTEFENAEMAQWEQELFRDLQL